MMERKVMVSACILICCEPRKYSDVAKMLKEVKGVVRTFSTSGRWDVIAEVEVGDVPYFSLIHKIGLKEIS